MSLGHNTHIGLIATKGNKDTNTNLHLFRQRRWNGIGEDTVERHREYDVDKQNFCLEVISGRNLPGLGCSIVLDVLSSLLEGCIGGLTQT